jgi:hypothetical protein
MTPIVGLAPDSDPNTQGIFTACSAVIPFESGFKGAPSAINATAAALSAACIGATVATKLDGTRRVFSGTTAKLYELSGTSWTDRTRASGGDYNGGSDTRWSFCQFGDTTVAANLADTIQSSSSGAFADITGAPKAKIVISASNNFVIAFNTVDATYGTSPDRWWCCAQADQTSWTPNVSTLATTGRLVSTEGPLTAALPLGNEVIAYKARGVYRGSFVGSPFVWQWDLVPGGEAGCVGQEALCDIGGAHFFVSNDNFWVFDGARPIPIGDGVIRQWFLNNSSPQYRYRTKCAYDKQNNLVRVYFPSSASTGACDSTLVFHVGVKKWGRSDRLIEAPLNYIAPGVTIDGLDSFAATIDALPNIPVDSQYWQSGGQVASYFDTNHQLVSLNGPCGASSITFSDVGDDDTVSMVDRVRVRFTQSPATATATGFYKFNEGDSLVQGASGSINDGKFDVRQSGRFHRIRIDMTGDHKETGYDVKLIPVGGR